MLKQELVQFADVDILARLNSSTDVDLDKFEFGVIGFDAQLIVCRYNLQESRYTGFRPERVIGQSLFERVAPCMNNHLVAGQFRLALEQGNSLDKQQDFVIRLNEFSGPVSLRLLAAPTIDMQYLLIDHRPDRPRM